MAENATLTTPTAIRYEKLRMFLLHNKKLQQTYNSSFEEKSIQLENKIASFNAQTMSHTKIKSLRT